MSNANEQRAVRHVDNVISNRVLLNHSYLNRKQKWEHIWEKGPIGN